MRTQAASIVADYAAERLDVLGDLVVQAEVRQFQALLPKLRAHGERAVARSKEAFTVLPSRETSAPCMSCATACVQERKQA